jgi:hypothetical protein
MSTVAERVANGAAFLDGREPGWWERIDLDDLEMGSQCGCVLSEHSAAQDREYAALEAEWKRVITERRAQVLTRAAT